MGVYLYTFRAQTVKLRPLIPEGDYHAPQYYEANVMKFLCRLSQLETGYFDDNRFERIQRAAHLRRWEGKPVPKLVVYGKPTKGTSVMLTETMELATDWGNTAWFDCNKGREYGVLGDFKDGAWDIIVTYEPRRAAAEDKLYELLPTMNDAQSPEAWEMTREAVFAVQRQHSAERARRLNEYGGFRVEQGWVEVVS